MATDFAQKTRKLNLLSCPVSKVHACITDTMYPKSICIQHTYIWTSWLQSPKSNRSQEDHRSFYYNGNIQFWEEMSHLWHLTQCSCCPYSVAIKEKSIVQLLSNFLEVSLMQKKKMERWTFWCGSGPGCSRVFNVGEVSAKNFEALVKCHMCPRMGHIDMFRKKI